MVKCLPEFEYFTVFLKNKNIIFKTRRSKVTDYAALNRFNGAPTSPLVQMWIDKHRCLVCMKDPYLINASSPRTYKSRYKKEIK